MLVLLFFSIPLTPGESGLVYRGYIDMGEGNELVAVKTGKSILSSYIIIIHKVM